mmetsp:Transcript_1468/g.3292  ORF Transcript_1468/g.3292 Transcript_1468/m.3292 type:complete len:287 (-) Transcript_1468:347-1207(-)
MDGGGRVRRGGGGAQAGRSDGDADEPGVLEALLQLLVPLQLRLVVFDGVPVELKALEEGEGVEKPRRKTLDLVVGDEEVLERLKLLQPVGKLLELVGADVEGGEFELVKLRRQSRQLVLGKHELRQVRQLHDRVRNRGEEVAVGLEALELVELVDVVGQCRQPVLRQHELLEVLEVAEVRQGVELVAVELHLLACDKVLHRRQHHKVVGKQREPRQRCQPVEGGRGLELVVSHVQLGEAGEGAEGLRKLDEFVVERVELFEGGELPDAIWQLRQLVLEQQKLLQFD